MDTLVLANLFEATAGKVRETSTTEVGIIESAETLFVEGVLKLLEQELKVEDRSVFVALVPAGNQTECRESENKESKEAHGQLKYEWYSRECGKERQL
jgi:hypothetical protein